MEDLNKLDENLEDANSTSEMTSFADWGSIISQVQDSLPAIDSDSELSTLTEDSDSELNIFKRNVITFNTDEGSSEKTQNKQSPSPKWQETNDKHDTVTVNSEGYGSASSSSPNSITSSSASKSTLSFSSEERVMQSDKTSSTSLLFQRLNQHLEQSVHTSPGGTEDLNLTDLDLELPIYEDDDMLMYNVDTDATKLDLSPPPIDMRTGSDKSAGESIDLEPSSDTEQCSSDTSSSVLEAVGKSGKAPVLSLKALEGFDLDELLDGLYESDASKLDSSRHEETVEEEKNHMTLMNQLINLSKTQQVVQKNANVTEGAQCSDGDGDRDANEHFLASRQFKEEPGGENCEEIEEKSDTEPVKEAMVMEVFTETKKTTTSSCGVTANIPKIMPAELSLSEPTTIFLDLRPSAVNITEVKPESAEDTTKFQNAGKRESVKRFSKRDDRTSTASKDNVQKRIMGLNKIKSMTKIEPVVSASDSDDNDDDYDEWKAMRNRIKARSCLPAAASPNSRSSSNCEIISLSSLGMGKEQNKTPSEESDSLFTPATSVTELPWDVDQESTPSFGENIPGIQHIDDAAARPNLANGLISMTELVDDGEKIDSEGSGGMPEPKDGGVGVYGSQRLKNDTGFPEGLSAEMPLPKPGVLKSSMRSETRKISTKEDKGKITVSFAEEPKQDENDTTSIYREKSLRTVSPSKVSSSIVQTEESFADNTRNLKVNDIVNRIMDPKYGEKELQMRSVNHESNSTVTDDILMEQSARVEQQFKQASAISTASLACYDRHATRERKIKQRNVLESILKTKGGNQLPGTQLLFDDDASFNFSLPNLPPELNVERTQTVLLTINLSSPGCVVAHRSTGGHKGGSVDSSIGFSVTYSMLLSWLLAIVPEDLQKLHNARMDDTFTIDMDPEYVSDVGNGKDSPCIPVSIDIPFNVVALHQSFQEDTQSLSLQAVVIPNFYYKPEAKRGRKKAKKEDAFLQVVWHFLQSNRIQDVCPWHERPESPMHYSLTETIVTCATKPLSCYVSAANDPVQIKKALRNNPGFFWKFVTPEDQTPAVPAATKINELETTTLLLNHEAFLYPVAVMDIVIRIQTSCSDLSGIRLAYVTKRFLYSNTLYHTTSHYDPEEIVPCVVMAIRGRSVIQKWSKIIGPRDPVLARLTERMSLNATYGEQLCKKRSDGSVPLDLNMFCHPRSESRAQQQLCVWFGGRADIKIEPIPSELQKPVDVLKAEKTTNGKNGGKNGKNRSRNGSTSMMGCNVEDPKVPDSVRNILSMPSYLITSCTTRLYLVVSPRLSPQFIGDVLFTAMQQGFLVEGIKRARLNERKAAALSISARYYSCFCPRVDSDMLVDFDYYDDIWWIRPATVILLARENAHAHQAGLWHSLQTDVMCNLSVPEEEGQMKMVTYQCFHTTPHTESVEHVVGSLTKVPDVELSTGSSPRNFYSNPEMEQVVVLSLLGERAIDESGLVLQKLLHGEFTLIPSNGKVITAADLEDESDEDDFRGFELLGLKWLPFLTSLQAKELTPFEVGTSAWHQSIPLLEASPVMLCVLRRVNAFEILDRILNIPKYSNTTTDVVLNEKNFYHVMSTTPEIAYRQMKIFFSDKELFSDNQSRPLLKYLPPPTRVYQYRHQQKSSARNGEVNAAGDQSTGSRPQDSTKKMSSKKKKKQNAKHKDSSNNFNNHNNGTSNGSTSFLPEESVFSSMVSCQQPLVSLLVIKPDAFPRHFIKIFKHLHQESFVVVAAKLLIMSEDEALQLVPPHLRDLHGETQVFLDHMTSGQSLIVCVQRSNAVRHLCQLAGPHDPVVARRRCYLLQRDDGYPLPYSTPLSMATWRALFGIDNISNGIHVSDSYISACQEMKRFFPEGLCCEETLELNMEMVPTPAEDTLMSLDKMKGREVKIELDERLTNRSLLMTYMPRKPIVVVMTPQLVQSSIPRSRPSRHPLTQRHIAPERGTVPPYVEILDKLLEQGFEVCALRMVWFKQYQAAVLVDVLQKSSVQQQCDDMIEKLVNGPSLLLVLQRENSLVLFDSILGSTKTSGESLYHRFSSHIMRSQNDSQTKEATRFLFSRICYHESVLTICHKKALEWRDVEPCGSSIHGES